MSEDDQQAPDDGAVQRPRRPAYELFGQQQTELDAKFAKLRAVAGEASKAHSDKFAKLFKEPPPQASIRTLLGADPIENLLPMMDAELQPDHRAAAASEATAERLEILVNAALNAAEESKIRDQIVDKREALVLRWTIAGVVLAAIAAVASIVAIVVNLSWTTSDAAPAPAPRASATADGSW